MLQKNKLFKSTISIILVLLLTITCMPISASAAKLEVVDLEIEPVTLSEGTSGTYYSDYNPETGKYDLEYYYYFPYKEMVFTATLSDGTVINDDGSYFLHDNEFYYFDIEIDQSYENQWSGGNTYYMTISIDDASVNVPVTITDSPFKSIEATPVSIMEYTEGDYTCKYNPETDECDLEYYEYYLYDSDLGITYTITLNDGTTIESESTWFEYDGVEYDIDISTGQSYDNQWTAGNTYSAKVSLLNLTAELPVTITECPFESIEVEPISIMEGTHGYYSEDYNEETGKWDLEYFHYSPYNDILSFTIKLKDGTTIENEYGNMEFFYNDEFYYLDCSTDQSYYTPWTAGNTYYMTVSYSNISAEVPVTITESPFESIEVKPISIMEGTCGNTAWQYNPETDEFDLEYFKYHPEYNMEYTITLKDGSTIEDSSEYFYYNDEYYEFNIISSQDYYNQWTAGNTYTFDVELFNLHAEVPVTITESPIKSIEVEPITLYEGLDGYNEYDYNPETDEYDLKYFNYTPQQRINYTLTLNDGSTIEGTGNKFEYNDVSYYLDYHTDQSYENQWTVGNTYNMTVFFNDISTEVPITIVKAPFKSIEVKPVSVIEKTSGGYIRDYDPETDEPSPEYYCYHPEGSAEFTITLNDGTTIDGKDYRFTFEGKDYYLSWETDQSYENQWTVGNTYNMTASFNDLTANVPVTIIENPFKSIEVKPITIKEFTNGTYLTDYNPETGEYDLEYYYYYLSDFLEYTITLNDGAKINSTGYAFEYDGETYYLSTKYDQSYENQWTAGNTYTVNVSLSTTSVDVPVTITSSTPTPTLKGDVDSDGLITIKDATMVQEHVARYKNLTDTSAINADVDGSGDINIVDATYIQMYVAKQITSFDKI